MPNLLERLKLALADRYAVGSEIGRGGMAGHRTDVLRGALLTYGQEAWPYSVPGSRYPGAPPTEHLPQLPPWTGPMTGLSLRLWHDGRLVPGRGWGCACRAPQSAGLRLRMPNLTAEPFPKEAFATRIPASAERMCVYK